MHYTRYGSNCTSISASYGDLTRIRLHNLSQTQNYGLGGDGDGDGDGDGGYHWVSFHLIFLLNLFQILFRAPQSPPFAVSHPLHDLQSHLVHLSI